MPSNSEIRAVLLGFEGVNVAEIDFAEVAAQEAIAAVYAPDIELNTLQSGLGTGVGEHYEGIDGMVRYLGEWLEPFSDYRVESLDYEEDGDFVLIPSRQWGIGAGSGVRVEIELTTLYELRDGRVARVDQFDTIDEARDEARRRASG